MGVHRHAGTPKGVVVKTVYLLRHAKSSWDDAEVADHDRPLAARGQRTAPIMGEYLRKHDIVPDTVLCSTALRARQTWDAVAKVLSPTPDVAFRRDIYDADANALLDILHALPADTESVMLIGHNPAFEEVARLLAGTVDPDAHRRMTEKFPTAALAELTFDVENWHDVQPRAGGLLRFVKPKEIAGKA